MGKTKAWFLCVGFLWYEWAVLLLLPNITNGSYVSLLLLLGVSFAFLATVLLLLLFLKHRGIIGEPPLWIVVVAAIGLSVSKVFTYFGQTFYQIPENLTPMFAMLASGSIAVLFYSLFHVASRFNLPLIRQAVFASIISGFLIYLFSAILYNINGVAFGCVEMTYPFVVALSFQRLRKTTKDDKGYHRKAGKLSAIGQSIKRISLIMLLYAMLVGLCIGKIDSLLPAKGHIETVLLTIGILVIAFFYLRKKTLISNVLNSGRAGIVIGIIGVLLVHLAGQMNAISYSVLMAGYFLFFATMFVFYVTLVQYQKELHPAEMLSIAMMIDSAGIALGMFMGFALGDLYNAAMPYVLFIAAVVFVVASSFFFDKKSLFPIEDDVSEPLRLNTKQIRVSCIQISTNKGLSSRQEEIFILLAYGHRINDVANMLGISSATVRSHVSQIYLKMDVHSNSELMAIIRETGTQL